MPRRELIMRLLALSTTSPPQSLSTLYLFIYWFGNKKALSIIENLLKSSKYE